MHISDGILSSQFLFCGWVISIIILYFSIKSLKYRFSSFELLKFIPKISVLTATFFVVSFIYIPVGFTSIHLMFLGPISILLGQFTYLSIFISLILQSIFLHCGGLLSLGVNSFVMGSGGLLNYYLYVLLRKQIHFSYAGGISTFISLFYSTFLLYSILYINGNLLCLSFTYFIQFHAIPMIISIIIESIVTVFVLHFLNRVKPELLNQNM